MHVLWPFSNLFEIRCTTLHGPNDRYRSQWMYHTCVEGAHNKVGHSHLQPLVVKTQPTPAVANPFKCDQCEKIKEYKTEKHDSNAKIFEWSHEDCAYTTKRKDLLIRHLKSHIIQTTNEQHQCWFFLSLKDHNTD